MIPPTSSVEGIKSSVETLSGLNMRLQRYLRDGFDIGDSEACQRLFYSLLDDVTDVFVEVLGDPEKRMDLVDDLYVVYEGFVPDLEGRGSGFIDGYANLCHVNQRFSELLYLLSQRFAFILSDSGSVFELVPFERTYSGDANTDSDFDRVEEARKILSEILQELQTSLSSGSDKSVTKVLWLAAER